MTISQSACVTVALAACVTDVRSRRIPNALTFGAAAAAIAFHAISGGLSAAGMSLAGWLLGVALFLLPFTLGGLGAGDVKLLAALGAWLGTDDIVWVALFSAIAGGVLAIAAAFCRGYARQMFRNIWGLLCYWRVMGLKPMPELTLAHGKGPRLAYAVPMLAGLAVKVCL